MGKQNINMDLDVHHIKDLRRGLIVSSNRIVVGFVSGTSFLADALILTADSQALPTSIPMFCIESVPLTILLGLCAFCVSTVLVAWLVFTILFRS